MMPTLRTSQPAITRRPVAGYILASVVVGIIGLVTAISITVSGIMNSYTAVGESYVDIFETGIDLGPQPTELSLDDARYTIVSFSHDAQAPSATDISDQCTIIDSAGDRLTTDTSTQQVTAVDRNRSTADLTEVQHLVFTHFEARSGAHDVTCRQHSLMSNGAGQRMGPTATYGIFTGLGSVLLAGGLFVLGVINSSRNKKAQALALSQRAAGLGR